MTRTALRHLAPHRSRNFRSQPQAVGTLPIAIAAMDRTHHHRLGSYTHGFPSGVSDRSSCWSPTYNPYANYAVPSPLWLPYGPGAVGQERGVLTLPHYRQGHYGQRQNVQNKIGGRQDKIGGRQRLDYASGHHNVVNINRIGQGIDVRTTVIRPFTNARLRSSNLTDHAAEHP